MVETFDIVQLVDQPVPRSETGEGAVDGEPVDDAGLVEVAGSEVARHAFFGDVGHEVIERDNGENTFAQVHEHGVDREPMEPGGEIGVTAEGSELAMDLKEGFLGQVFGQGEVAHNAHADGEDAFLVALVDFCERLMISSLSAGHEFGLVAF